MKKVMTQQEIKTLETAVTKATGWENVEIVVPTSLQELPSVDYRLLEMENKLNIARNSASPRQAKKAAKIAARNNMINMIGDKAMRAIDGVLGAIEEPKKLLNIKPIGALANYFFLLEDDEVETPVVIEQEQEPVKPQVVKEGKVVYLNFNK